jgi:hypothetical protein
VYGPLPETAGSLFFRAAHSISNANFSAVSVKTVSLEHFPKAEVLGKPSCATNTVRSRWKIYAHSPSLHSTILAGLFTKQPACLQWGRRAWRPIIRFHTFIPPSQRGLLTSRRNDGIIIAPVPTWLVRTSGSMELL